MLKLKQYLTPKGSIVRTELDEDSVILLNLDGTEFYTLNPTAARIWTLIGEQKRIKEIIDIFAEEYDCARTMMEKSILRQIKEFLKENLVEISNQKSNTVNKR